MTTESSSTPDVPESQSARHKMFRAILHRDTTPLAVLFAAAIVGTITGFVGVAFVHGVEAIRSWRGENLNSMVLSGWTLYLACFFVSAALAAVGYWLVKRFAPEAGGSGIPEIEGALEELRPVRWWRVIPVKFFGGMGTLGAGMVLGREGPIIQMGGNIGRMVCDLLKIKKNDAGHSLLAAGSAAGLTAAFNAPFAGILLILEEMRPQFRFTEISIKAVLVSVIMAAVVYRLLNGDRPVLDVGITGDAALDALWIYLIVGLIFGAVGVLFNKLVFTFQDIYLRIHRNRVSRFVLIGALLGGCCGVGTLYFSEAVGGGDGLIPHIMLGGFSLELLLIIFLLRMLTTVLCFSSGAPGGILAPVLAVGCVLGTALGLTASHLFPAYQLDVATFAVAGMGALFAASIRAPLTGILLVVEMTSNFQLILPLIVTCLGATLVAQLLGGQPIYSFILARTLAREAKKKAAPQEG